MICEAGTNISLMLMLIEEAPPQVARTATCRGFGMASPFAHGEIGAVAHKNLVCPQACRGATASAALAQPRGPCGGGVSVAGQGLGATGGRLRTAISALSCGVLAARAAARQAVRRRSRRGPHCMQATGASAVVPSGANEGSRAVVAATLRAATQGVEQLVTSVNPQDGPEGTYQVGIDFQKWLQSAQEEIEVKNLHVEGTLPAWLRGSLVHAGPAKFEFGTDEFVDWVDGQAMLYRLRILADGQCEYRNRWLNTSNHRAHRAAGCIAVRETCSRPSIPNFWDRILYMFQPPNNENGNLHISQFAAGGTRCCSMSVGSSLMEFSLNDMETIGKIPFNDELCEGGPLIFHAEPHVDPITGEWFTCAIQLRIDTDSMGMKPEYVVYSIQPSVPQQAGEPLGRRLIARIPTQHPSPVHTLALTHKYIVMIQIPYPLNWDGMIKAEGKWLLTGEYEGNLNDYNQWQPERPTIIRLIDRVTGEQADPFQTDPFFFFHTINAFEEGNDVFVDVVCYSEPPVGFPLRQARSGDMEDWRGGGGEVRRFKMDLSSGECSWTGWPDNCFDEPKVNPKVDGLKHRYSWGLIDDHGMLRLTKQDHNSHEVVKWRGQDVSRELPWQPVFIPEPYSEREDAGILMSFVRDQPSGNTFCVLVDTDTMEECARIHFPAGHHVPLHGHGMWMPGKF